MLKFNKNYLFVLIISSISLSFSQDGCDLPEPVNDGYLFITSDGNVLYNSKSDIYGFQFNVNGGTLTQGSIGNGGASEEAEFDVTVGLDNLILGFSLTGSYIPSGCGILTDLDSSGEIISLIDIIVSGNNGTQKAFDYFIGGCSNVNACSNYSPYAAAGCTDGVSLTEADCIADSNAECVSSINPDAADEATCESMVCVDSSSGEVTGDTQADCTGTWVQNGEWVSKQWITDDNCDLPSFFYGATGCALPVNSIYLTDSGSLLYNSSTDIGGFELSFTGTEFGDSTPAASGGIAEQQDFELSTTNSNAIHGTMLLGFSLSGASIPAGCGTIVELDLTGIPTAVDHSILSDLTGNNLNLTVHSGDHCEEQSCNTQFDECGVCDGSGLEDGKDCAGNCLDGNTADCAGVCGGTSVVDVCGVCNGPGAIYDCPSVSGVENCIALESNACDCEGNILDECGVCNGGGIAEGTCDCEGSVLDCAGECGGSAVVDCAGECGGSAVVDCDGVCGGLSILEEGECVLSIIKEGLIPDQFAISQNYPNPFNPSTRIRFDVAKFSDISIIVYDLSGKEVIKLIDGAYTPGIYEVLLDLSQIDDGISSGMYVYRLITENIVISRKMLYLK